MIPLFFAVTLLKLSAFFGKMPSLFKSLYKFPDSSPSVFFCIVVEFCHLAVIGIVKKNCKGGNHFPHF